MDIHGMRYKPQENVTKGCIARSFVRKKNDAVKQINLHLKKVGIQVRMKRTREEMKSESVKFRKRRKGTVLGACATIDGGSVRDPGEALGNITYHPTRRSPRTSPRTRAGSPASYESVNKKPKKLLDCSAKVKCSIVLFRISSKQLLTCFFRSLHHPQQGL